LDNGKRGLETFNSLLCGGFKRYQQGGEKQAKGQRRWSPNRRDSKGGGEVVIGVCIVKTIENDKMRGNVKRKGKRSDREGKRKGLKETGKGAHALGHSPREEFAEGK